MSNSVEVGRTEITIRDLLRLNEGSFVELERLAGDPLDILINNTKIAKVIVMIGERFGVRFGKCGSRKTKDEAFSVINLNCQ